MNKHPLSNTYQTGTTTPPKSYAGVVSFLLSATIVICGISTIFSLLRINLLQKWDTESKNQVCQLAFSEVPQAVSYEGQPRDLPFRGEPVNTFWQNYHGLPQGIYVTHCYGQSLHVGDVITQLDGTPIQTWESIDRLLGRRQPGDTIEVTVFRQGQHLQMTLTIYE
jgi:hypothetical protein